MASVATVEIQIENAVDALNVHGEPLEAVRDFARNGVAVKTADLLEIGKLRNFHAVAPNFPAKTPGAERRALPIVLDEANVIQRRIDADGIETREIELLDIRRRRLHDDLKLVVVLQPVRDFPRNGRL